MYLFRRLVIDNGLIRSITKLTIGLCTSGNNDIGGLSRHWPTHFLMSAYMPGHQNRRLALKNVLNTPM